MRAHLGLSTLDQNLLEGSETHKNPSVLTLHSLGLKRHKLEQEAGPVPTV